jgi:toxin ParE1/3/4
MYALKIRPIAESDVAHSRDWYEERRDGLGDDFVEAFNELCQRICADPQLFAVAERNVRRGKLRRFPYVVYYRVVDQAIEILAVLHGSRDPRTWKRHS